MAHRHQRMPIVRLGLHTVTLNMLNCQKTHRMLSSALPRICLCLCRNALLCTTMPDLQPLQDHSMGTNSLSLCSISVCVKYGIKGLPQRTTQNPFHVIQLGPRS